MTAQDTQATVPAPQSGRKARICAECGTSFVPARPQQQFCESAHKIAFQNRAAAEGRAVIALAKAWRASRNSAANRELGSKCLSELAAILDLFNSDDRAAGRPSPMIYAESLLKQGRFIDRRR